MKKKHKEMPFPVLLIGMIICLVILIFITLGVGRYFISPINVVKIFLSKFFPVKQTWDDRAVGVISTLRVPRMITALLVGMALSLSGASYQGVFKNPLVAPDMLGVSSGACVGASMAILMHVGNLPTQIMAFAGGLIAVFMALMIPRLVKNQSMMTLVLAGIIVSGLMNSFLGIIKYVADPETELADITHWQLGSLSASTWQDIYSVAPAIIVASIIIIAIRWRINVMSLGEDEAKSLGMNVTFTRTLIVICSTVLTASAVCISGTIGWIGLVIPHFGRLIVGPDNRKLIPVSAVLGAGFLLLIDTLARNITSAEIPLSILTGLIGAPFYFYLLLRQRMKLS